jgi:hypothetical protein
MALSPLLLVERRRRGVWKKPSLSLTVLSLYAEARGLLSQTQLPPKPLTASTYQPENLELDYAPGLQPVRMREQLDRPKHYETR